MPVELKTKSSIFMLAYVGASVSGIFFLTELWKILLHLEGPGYARTKSLARTIPDLCPASSSR